jgi:hypothetical protein
METRGRHGGRRAGGALLPVAVLLPLVLLSAPVPSPAAEDESPDAAVLRRIAEVRERAGALRIDGSPRDWKGIPSFEDGDPAPVADRSLDLRSLSVAPRDDVLLALLQFPGLPSRARRAFSLDIDFLGRSARDAAVRFGAEGRPEVAVYPEEGKPAWVEGVRVEVGATEAVEIRVPLAPLAAALGGPGKAWLAGARRSFVRVQAFTWRADPLGKAENGEVADEGPAAASFLLADPPPVLDPPPGPEGKPVRAMLPPLQGRWFVRQGAHGLWSHREVVAYDLCIEDHALRSTPKPGSRRLEDYYSFGRPIFAPEAGTVAFDSLQAEDRKPLEETRGKDCGNTLILRFADGLRLLLGHLRQGSLALDRAEPFRPGDLVAEVGNSGDSGAPHLHLSLHEKPGEFVGLPLAFRKVRVGLNPGSDDPWNRDLPEWGLREGWFFEGR